MYVTKPFSIKTLKKSGQQNHKIVGWARKV